MGTFSTTCNLTGLPIEEQDDVFYLEFNRLTLGYNIDILTVVSNFFRYYDGFKKRKELLEKVKLATTEHEKVSAEIDADCVIVYATNPFVSVGFDVYNGSGSIESHQQLNPKLVLFHKKAVLDICKVQIDIEPYDIVAKILNAMFLLRRRLIFADFQIGHYVDERSYPIIQECIKVMNSISREKYSDFLEISRD